MEGIPRGVASPAGWGQRSAYFRRFLSIPRSRTTQFGRYILLNFSICWMVFSRFFSIDTTLLSKSSIWAGALRVPIRPNLLRYQFDVTRHNSDDNQPDFYWNWIETKVYRLSRGRLSPQSLFSETILQNRMKFLATTLNDLIATHVSYFGGIPKNTPQLIEKSNIATNWLSC